MGAEEEKTEEQTPEEEFDSIFEDETLSEESEEESTEDKVTEKAEEDDPPKKEAGEEEESSSEEEDTDWEKRFKDTQSWATKLSQENKDLKDKLESDESDETADGFDSWFDGLSGDQQEAIEDQELKESFEALFNVKSAGKAVPDDNVMKRIENAELQANMARFDLAITGGFVNDKGEFVEGHPDAVKIFSSKEYRQYHDEAKEAKNPLIESSDPADAIKFIGKFKEDVLKEAASEHDTKAKEKAEETNEALESTVDTKAKESPSTADLGTQEDEFDKAFDELPKEA